MTTTPIPVPMRAPRDVSLRRVRFFPAVFAGAAAALAFIVVYYLTLGLLPPVFSNPIPSALFPVPAWAYRMDLAQFLGSLVAPPYPTPFTWGLGLALMFGSLLGLAVVYALLLSWVQDRSDTIKGLVFGLANGVGLVFLISIANGLHPAIMRNALADTGAFMVGWSFWAPFQLLLPHAVYGAVLGNLYGRR
jgi:hypothetical protein